MKDLRSTAWFVLTVLFLINMVNFFDRFIIGALGEPIRREFSLSDTSLGLLSTAFTLVYAVAGIPLGRLADAAPRRTILAGGVFLWSLFTAATGAARQYWQLFALRIGVGVGEASCAPAAASLIADIFPSEKRGRAMSIFMLGLPVGIALSFALSGSIAQAYGWRAAFAAAGIPGIVLTGLALLIREPRREQLPQPNSKGVFRRILSSRTMWWLIASGALHNFCLYALSSFMTPYLMRHHHMNIRDAGFFAMLVNGVFTLPGLLLGGVLGDRLNKYRPGGGLLLTAATTILAVPLFAAAAMAESGGKIEFLIAMGGAFALMYFYYSITYAAIADLNVPEHRGSAMSAYFFAMYVFGGALGPYVVGAVSDHFTRRAAAAAGVTETAASALEPFRGAGLQSAFYVVPVVCLLLAVVMLMAGLSFRKELAAAAKPSDGR